MGFVETVLERLPVFPLPSAVLFPGIVIPLHVDEPRYRKMVSDSIAADNLLAIAMIKPGSEEEDHPELFDVAGVGRIIHCEKQMGGDYNILVQGLDRIRLVEEVPTDVDYRCFRAELIPRPSNDEAEAAQSELLKLESCVISLVASVQQTDAELVEVVRSTPDPIQLADYLAATVVSDINQQQDLLATADLKSRIEKLIDAVADAMVRLGELPPQSQMN